VTDAALLNMKLSKNVPVKPSYNDLWFNIDLRIAKKLLTTENIFFFQTFNILGIDGGSSSEQRRNI